MRPGPHAAPRRRIPPDDGDLEVFVADEQDAHPVDVARWSKLATDVLDARGIRGDAELSVLFVDDTSIAALNAEFMDTAGPTDVLAFPLEDEVIETGRSPDSGTTGPDREPPEPDDLPLLLGDVVICPSVAAANAPTHAGSYDDEIALLLVHGILHVLGMDHDEPEAAAAMQAAERDLLARFHGPLAADPWSTEPS